MIDNLKFDSKMSFVTITLRNLDSKENKDVVSILEKFMAKRDIKTGQRAIEEIIKEYAYTEQKLKDEKSLNIIEKQELDKIIRGLNEENKELKECFAQYKNFTELLKKIKL